MRRFYRFRCVLPSSRAGFGPLLWEFLGHWHEGGAAGTGLYRMVAKASGICQRRLESA